VEVPKPGKKLPPTPLRPEEMERLLSLCVPDSQLGKRNRAIVEMLYACGLRRAELLGLNVGDLDFRAGTVFVRGKGGKERLLPVYDTASKAVADYLSTRGGILSKTEPIFAVHYRKDTQGKRMTEGDLAHVFRHVRKRFPKHIHPHLLRHTFACHLLQGGADIRYVQALLGHEFPDTTSKYLGLVKEDIKREYDLALEALLSGQEAETGEAAGYRRAN
jgi:site-specific recombinase XerD